MQSAGKRRSFVRGLLAVAMAGVAPVWTWADALALGPGGIPVGRVEPAEAVVNWHDTSGVAVTVRCGALELEVEPSATGEYVRVRLPESPVSGQPGHPELPVVRRLVRVPAGAAATLAVSAGEPWVLDLAAAGLPQAVWPAQGPQSMGPAGLPGAALVEGSSHPLLSMLAAPFLQDAQAYARDQWGPAERATLTRFGVMSGVELHLLEIRPVAYNPAQGLLAVWPDVQVHVTFDRGAAWNLPSVGAEAGVAPRPTPVVDRLVVNPEPPRAPQAGRAGGNFLIITAQDLAGSAPLTQFVNAKTAQGYVVTTYTAVPTTHRDAIKAFVGSLWGTADEPEYVLIVGDVNWLGTQAEPGIIPAFRGVGSMQSPTDTPYVCMDGVDDWLPDIPIGRLAVRTPSELQEVVDKTLCVAGGAYPDPGYAERAAFIAGPDPLADGETHNNYIIDTYMAPAGITSSKLYTVTYGATTQDVKDAVNEGCFLIGYFGHAAGFQAWGYPTFTFADIESLTNANLYPFIASFSCSSTAVYGASPTLSPGFIEKWMLVSDRGAVAGYGPAVDLGPYTWTTWADLYKALFASIYSDDIRELGPACQAALGRFVTLYGTADPVSRDYAEIFHYLGDPSLRLPDPPLNYLIVTAPNYYDSAALNQFIAAKQARGFNVQVYNLPSGTSNTTLKNYIKALQGTGDEPDYVLLVGDTSGATSSTTTVPHFTGGGDKSAPTDWPYVCWDAGDDWYPEIPIGRFSVTSTSMLQDVVNKVLYVEAGNYPNEFYARRGAFLANPDTYNTAEPTHDFVIDEYLEPEDYIGIKLYAAQGADTADVTNAVNAGCAFVVYMGHSGSSGWWDPSFSQSNVNALLNTGLYPVVCGWSCNTSNFPSSECFGETWQRAPNKGAAAYISATTYIYWGSVEAWAPSGAMEKGFFRAMFKDGLWEVGPAWLAGMYHFLTDYGGWDGDPDHDPPLNLAKCRNFMEEFAILGDPAMLLPRPNGFSVSVDPPNVDRCTPPDTEAVYTVGVGLLGEFPSPVTLSAQSLPPGTAVTFTVNDEPPPFTSIMRITGIGSAAQGQHTIRVSGSGGGDVHNADVTLSVSTGVPAPPALTAPPNGAVNVGRQPTLQWQDVPGAFTYTLEIATDSGFLNVVYSVPVADHQHTVVTPLDGDTQYFWHVRAENGCGLSDFSAAYHFRTLLLTNYFTEQFTSSDPFDLEYLTIEFEPNGSGDFYGACRKSAAAFPTDPTGGTTLALPDDGSSLVTPASAVWLYGTARTSFYVNANGSITFGSSDNAWQETFTTHFSKPRVAALFDDLNPTQGGSVSWKQTGDRVAVTWQEVPQISVGDSNSFQIELFFDGRIHVTWLRVDSNDSIVGLSNGAGTPTDFAETDLSDSLECGSGPPTGACCVGQTCELRTETECATAGGTYQGDSTTCSPDPCIEYNTTCLIISEIVQGTESGDCPRWIELTNTGSSDFYFREGGVIVQTGSSTDVIVDVDLTGVLIPAGQSFVVASNAAGMCTGAFYGVYGKHADMYTNIAFGYGDERYILTDTVDGSNLTDIYGEFGVDGTGQPWEFTDGYAYRRPEWNSASGTVFEPNRWFIGGPGSLAGPDPTALLLSLTTPGVHAFNEPCSVHEPGDIDGDGDLDIDDVTRLLDSMSGPDVTEPPPGVNPTHFTRADLDHDKDVDLADVALMQRLYAGG